MNLYERILSKLILESEKLKDLPDEDILRSGLLIVNELGVEYEISKVSEDNKSFLITRPGYKSVVSYEQLVKNFRRA